MVKTLKEAPRKRGRKPKNEAIALESVTALKRRKKWEVTPREWSHYKKNQTDELRQTLLNKYLPLVRNVATRMAMGFPRSVELSDLINTGVIGLIEAFGNFDPSRGVKFETYAVPRIRGAILDELRALDWVPRSTRAKSREIDRAMVNLENKLGRQPEKKELARQLNITEEELYITLDDVSCSNILSLDEIIYPDDDNRQLPRIETVSDATTHSILGEIEKGELRSFLVVAIDRLTAQEKLVIALYYFEELTLKEIGEVMSISESRVSQIHTRAVMKLRNMVKEKFALTG
ncbi:MAG: FliA/WhiG family RNA polymerase sigma factor [candidate division Zixibacteria bacterium]|nr:FliA/WhiG family RNA polymerase sigma factor [candidate division Zixibacteria bacterium]